MISNSSPKVNESDPICSAVRQCPDAPAIRDAGRVLTYRELESLARTIAAGLRRFDIFPGDPIGILARPSVESIALIVACIRSGVIAAPLNEHAPPNTLLNQLTEIGAKALAVDTIGYTRAPQWPHPIIPLEALAKNHPDPGQALSPPNVDNVCTILYTSGSGAKPKPAVHALRNHLANARASNQNIPLGTGDAWLLSLPLYHVSGMAIVFRCLIAAAAIAVPNPAEPPESAVGRLRVTHLSLVATQLLRLLRSRNALESLRALKAILLGGGPIPTDLVMEAHRRQMPLHTTYGLTECASQVATTRPDALLEELLTSGHPIIPGTVRVSDQREIQVAGPCLFLGYLDGGSVLRPTTPDGWFATGDLGEMDSRGCLRVIGRKDNLIISGGENIQPEEIEAALRSAPGVEDALVVPVPDTEYGARPVAFVRLRSERELEPALLIRHLELTLPRFKIPRTFLDWPADAPSGTFKPPRAFFADRARQETENR